MVTEIDHPKIGRMKNMGSPVKTSVEFTKTRTPRRGWASTRIPC